MHPLEWFIDRVGLSILRGTTEILINDEEMAKKLFSMQSEDYRFIAKL